MLRSPRDGPTREQRIRNKSMLAGQRKERRLIVAFIRAQADDWETEAGEVRIRPLAESIRDRASAYRSLADAIEKGRHLE